MKTYTIVMFIWLFLAFATIALLVANHNFTVALLTLTAWAGGIASYYLYVKFDDRALQR